MSNNSKNPHQRLWEFHGFDVEDQGGQLVSDCPSCGKESHVYINAETGQWDCKVCSVAGNSYTLLSLLVDQGEKVPAEEVLAHRKKKAISSQRRKGAKPIRPKYFKSFEDAVDSAGIFLHPRTGLWALPVYRKGDAGQTSLVNLRLYDPSQPRAKWYSSPGLKQHPWVNTFALLDENPEAYLITEGEWDGLMAHSSLLGRNARPYAVLSTCGSACNLEMPSFASLVKDARVRQPPVYIVMDDDEAGKATAKKLSEALTAAGVSHRVYLWPHTNNSGLDLTDAFTLPKNPLFKGSPSKSLTELIEDEAAWGDTVMSASPDNEAPTAGPPITFRKCLEEWEDADITMSGPLADALLLSVATVIGPQWDGVPIWTYLVGPPGSGKSLLLESFEPCPTTHFEISLHKQALVSGWKGATDSAILARIMNPPKTLIVKDYTTVIAMPPKERGEMASILRDAFDGTLNKTFGNQAFRSYRGRFGILAGVTPAIHKTDDAELGARFLKFSLPSTRHLKVDDLLDQALLSITKGDAGRFRATKNQRAKATSGLVEKALFSIHEELPIPTPKQQRELKALSRFVSYCRAKVERDTKTEDSLYEADVEAPTRIVQQLARLAQMISVVEGSPEITPRAMRIVTKCAWDTGVGRQRFAITLALEHGYVSVPMLERASRSSVSTASRVIRDLCELGALVRWTDAPSRRGAPTKRYQLSHRIKEYAGLSHQLAIKARATPAPKKGR